MKSLYPSIKIINESNSEDTAVMKKALNSKTNFIDIGHAGTAMRFLASYFASKLNSEITLTGSDRMKNRPIGILVDALRDLGAEIEYEEKQGYPPLRIIGKNLIGNEVSLPANISSQFISSLMMLGVKIDNGIKLNLEGNITSKPYILMTKKLIDKIGCKVVINNNEIEIWWIIFSLEFIFIKWYYYQTGHERSSYKNFNIYVQIT